jgi:ABC-type polar amino acid transport system ATPase subunit
LRPVRAEATRSVAVTVRGVSHAFDLAGTKLPVLDSIDLSVAAGEFIALLGPSGYGKSTLLHLVSGLERPTAGTITADELQVERPDPSHFGPSGSDAVSMGDRLEQCRDQARRPRRTHGSLSRGARGAAKYSSFDIQNG